MFIPLIIILTINLLQNKGELPKIGQSPPPVNYQLIYPETGSYIDSWENYNDRVVILDFWATWCTPCIKAFPKINMLVDLYPDSLVSFISVTYEPKRMLEPFLKKHQLKSQIAIDNDFATFKSFNAFGIPLVVVINTKGKVAAVTHPDYLTKELIDEVIAGKVPDVEPARAWSDPEGAEEHFRSLIKP